MAAPALTRMLAFSVAGAIVGAAVGLIYGAIHAGLLLCLGTWAALAIVIGFTSTAWKPAAVSSATFGFAVSLGFLIAGYAGSEPITKPLTFFILLAFFGAAFGGVLGVAARFSRTRFL
jgi:hypothetical protein